MGGFYSAHSLGAVMRLAWGELGSMDGVVGKNKLRN